MVSKVKKTGFIIFISYIVTQVLRLAANLIVARWLAPEMYAIAAVGLIARQGIEMMSDVGIAQYILSHKEHRNELMLNTVWTIQVIRGWILFIITLILSIVLWALQTNGIVENLGVLSNKDIPLLLAIMSLTSLFSGYRTLARFVYGRELNRLKLEIIEIIAQLCGIVTMLTWAWIWPSLWALPSAAFVSTFVLLLSSFLLFDIKHKLHFDKKIVKDIFNFSKWIFIATALTFLSDQLDRIFLSFNVTETQLGLYSITVMLIAFPLLLINRLNYSLWLPALSNKQNDIGELSKYAYKIKIIQELGISAFILILGCMAPMLIKLMYDERYSNVSYMLQFGLPAVLIISSLTFNNVILMVFKETRIQMMVMLVRVISLLFLLPLLFNFYGLLGAFVAIFISLLIGLIPQFIVLHKLGCFSITKEFRVIPLVILSYISLVIFVNQNYN